MRREMVIHPQSKCQSVGAVAVEIVRPRAGLLTLRYVLTGAIAGLRLPAPAAAGRTDELWQHTCCEAFLQAPGERGYVEYNFAPSTAWQCYRLDDIRSNRRPAEVAPPHLAVKAGADALELTATVAWEDGGRLGLTAVIEEANGAMSYWALAHAPGKPDFHRPETWGVELGA
ncbi:MAG: DOMON-like domain-containing protein [Alphaproteobacteria bacterium]|nr:DOMON-like domain-containing protein [Alphaproteobacteria bacterium]